MRRIDIFKLMLALCAVVLFAWGVRADDPVYRWAGTACLVAAVALRFIKPKPRS